MLSILFTDPDHCVYNIDGYFKYKDTSTWFSSDFVKRMVKDIDKSDVLSPYCIQSPVLGQISPDRLSGGLKALLLMLYDDTHIFNASQCGNNCAKWILEIGEMKDVTIRLGHLMNFGTGEFDIKFINNGKIYHRFNDEFIADAANLIDEVMGAYAHSH